VDLRTVVQDMEQMLRRLVGEDVQVKIALPARPAPALVDAGQMGQVLMNLAANARDAMPDGGQLSIDVETVHLDESYAAVHAGVSAGDYVRLTVSDTGTGMDAATQAHLFEPFFTTKVTGRGTGLGLSSAFGIVKQSGGHVWAYSEPGRGSSFKIHLPLAAGEPSSAAAAPATAAPTGGNETILVVEDHAEVRELVVAALEARGYRILAASDAEQAAILAREHARPVHLLITDVVLPGQNGRGLADRLSAEQPGLRVLFTSGYTQDVIAHRGILEAGIDYLAKPFSPDDLARRVRAILDR
jgi:CheY-like chemotaxis protein